MTFTDILTGNCIMQTHQFLSKIARLEAMLEGEKR